MGEETILSKLMGSMLFFGSIVCSELMGKAKFGGALKRIRAPIANRIPFEVHFGIDPKVSFNKSFKPMPITINTQFIIRIVDRIEEQML